MPSLREIRLEAGVTLRDAAQEIGRSHGAVARWELSEREPENFDDIRKLAEFYLAESRRRAEAVESLTRAKGLVEL